MASFVHEQAREARAAGGSGRFDSRSVRGRPRSATSALRQLLLRSLLRRLVCRYRPVRFPPGAIRQGAPSLTRCALTAIRPSPFETRLLQSGLSREVCSPGTGGKSRRTKLDIVDEARALFSLPPLASVDAGSVLRHGEQYAARQAAMGSPVTSDAVTRDLLDEVTAAVHLDRADEGPVSGSLTGAGPVSGSLTGRQLRLPPRSRATRVLLLLLPLLVTR